LALVLTMNRPTPPLPIDPESWSDLPFEALLTAYALGELPGDRPEHAAVQAKLEQDPALQAEVDAIREAGRRLARAFDEESVAWASSPVSVPAAGVRPRWMGSRYRAGFGALAAAAGVGLVFWVVPGLPPGPGARPTESAAPPGINSADRSINRALPAPSPAPPREGLPLEPAPAPAPAARAKASPRFFPQRVEAVWP
jgi:anti-sigma factor RsiW